MKSATDDNLSKLGWVTWSQKRAHSLANLTPTTLTENQILKSIVNPRWTVCSAFFAAWLGLAMDQHQDYMNNAPNSYSYNSGDSMSASLAGLTINNLHHQENGIQLGQKSPGDGSMKG